MTEDKRLEEIRNEKDKGIYGDGAGYETKAENAVAFLLSVIDRLKEELSKENSKTFDKDSVIKVEEDKE